MSLADGKAETDMDFGDRRPPARPLFKKNDSDMNKTRKTYGINGFMEYQAVIKVGKSSMKVLFAGGSMSAKGVIPCTFTTGDYMTQHAIENSKAYQDGLIYTVSVIPIEGNVEIERPRQKPLPTAPAEEKHADTAEENQESEQAGVGPGLEQPATVDEATEGGPEETPIAEVWPAKSKNGSPLTPVEFASNDEAKDYLEEHFGLVRSKLRNREDICAAGKANGVEIIFI